ncbi:MAG: hypothetical protein WC509_08465 [Candidatus Izemoplasmatales bacterium]
MKRFLSAALAAFLALAILGCAKPEGLTAIVPSGSPALAQIYVQTDGRHAVSVVNGADPLVAAFGSGSHDVVFAPTNLGAKMIAAGADYRFAAAVVWGNYYLVTTGKTSFTLDGLDGASILAFGQNQTSDIVLRHLLSENDVDATLTYVDAVASAAALFAADPTLVVLTAEPSLSALCATVDGLQVIDLQDEYAALHGEGSYPQAGVFVMNGIDADRVDAYLTDLAASVSAVNDDPAAAAAAGAELGFGFSEAVMTGAIPGSHLAYVAAADARTALEAYFAIILEMNPALIGGTLPGEGFYLER